jgi:hypothetical protein
MKCKKYKPFEGNIKAEAAYDPFPKTGLVKQFGPYIRKVVGEFANAYPRVRRRAQVAVVKGALTASPPSKVHEVVARLQEPLGRPPKWVAPFTSPHQAALSESAAPNARAIELT